MSYNLVERCPNVFNINEAANKGKRPLTPQDITEMTLIIEKDGFEVQNFEENLESTRIFYIQKYNVVLTAPQVEEFCDQHANELFLLVDNYNADMDDIWFYVISETDNLTVYCYHAVGGGHMSHFATLHNVPGESTWQEPQLVPGSQCLGIDTEDKHYSYRTSEPNKFYFKFQKSSSSYINSTDSGQIINIHDSKYKINTHELMRTHLRIGGRTRITLAAGYRSFFTYEAGRKPQLEKESINKRYGLEMNPEYSYSYKWGGQFMYQLHETFESEIPEEDWERIKHRLSLKLEQMDKNDKDAYSKVLQSSSLLITAPIPGHRRPSFHYIVGFRCNHITEIVELSRGELLMKDMLPENIYCLMEDGRYCLVSHDIKSSMKEMITRTETEIDSISFNKWAEEKSLHPNLLRLLGESYFDTIDLKLVKLFNRIPFGALLIDQLITAGHSELAVQLAEYITSRAYDFNFYCSKLSDLFPGCNGDETSLFKILNINRNVARYLFEDVVTAQDFITKYTAIHHFGGNQVLTDEIKGNVETYMFLYKKKEHSFRLSWGDREFDFLNYPKLAKQIVRMRKKIAALQGLTNDQMHDIENKYDEIVRAYCSFLDYSTIAPEDEKDFWLPEHQRIFVEFSLLGTETNPLNPIEEVSSREKDANRALKVYQAKADEKIKMENEEKFAYRRKTINKLRSLVEFEKTTPAFINYTVIAPTQIYGFDVVGSVEKEAYDLDHCLFRCYTNRIVSGDYTTMWLRLRDHASESLITIGITSDGRIEQTRGQDDRDATPEEAKAIAAWAESKIGLVTFQSEGSDVAPGGWPRGVPVPSLPKPGKDWLARLHQTHE